MCRGHAKQSTCTCRQHPVSPCVPLHTPAPPFRRPCRGGAGARRQTPPRRWRRHRRRRSSASPRSRRPKRPGGCRAAGRTAPCPSGARASGGGTAVGLMIVGGCDLGGLVRPSIYLSIGREACMHHSTPPHLLHDRRLVFVGLVTRLQHRQERRQALHTGGRAIRIHRPRPPHRRRRRRPRLAEAQHGGEAVQALLHALGEGRGERGRGLAAAAVAASVVAVGGGVGGGGGGLPAGGGGRGLV